MKVKMILPPLTEVKGPFWWPSPLTAPMLMALPSLMATWPRRGPLRLQKFYK
jgi:hypothetical protein